MYIFLISYYVLYLQKDSNFEKTNININNAKTIIEKWIDLNYFINNNNKCLVCLLLYSIANKFYIFNLKGMEEKITFYYSYRFLCIVIQTYVWNFTFEHYGVQDLGDIKYV